MTAERWRKIEELLDACAGVNPAEREALLADRCVDAELRAEVESMLREEENLGSFLDQPAIAQFRDVSVQTLECPTCLTCFDDSASVCPTDGTALVHAFYGPRLIDRTYVIERRLGRGGMGSVYLAQHVGLEKRFALKLIAPGAGTHGYFVRRFEQEAKTLGQLKHPNIVDVTDYGVDPRDGGQPYLVMEHLRGASLYQYSSSKALSVEDVLSILDPLADAIDFAHSKNILHRDLKPANIFVTESEREVKVLDFGLAKFADAGAMHATPPPASHPGDDSTTVTVTTPGQSHKDTVVAGTPAYMAPEVLAGMPASRESDLYAVGVVVYELLTNELPMADPVAPSARSASVPPEMDAPVLALLRKDPGQRPQSAKEAVAALRSAWIQAAQRVWNEREVPRRIVMAAVLACVVVLGAILLRGMQPIGVAENWTMDARFSSVPARAPDPRLLLLSIDEDTLATDATPLADRADGVARQLDRVFEAGARGVAIDALLPERWSQSAAFSQFVLRRADTLRLAYYWSPGERPIGVEAVTGLAAAVLGPRMPKMFGLVNLEPDVDGVVRHGRTAYRDVAGTSQATWAANVVRLLNGSGDSSAEVRTGDERYWIDYSIDWDRIPRISWKDLDATLEKNAGTFRDRVVLLGAEFAASGDNNHSVPAVRGRSETISGLQLQAVMANSIAQGPRLRSADAVVWAPLVMVLASLVAANVLLMRNGRAVALLFGGALGAYIAVAWIAFRTIDLVMPIASPLLMLAAGLLVGWVLRWRLPRFPEADSGGSKAAQLAARQSA